METPEKAAPELKSPYFENPAYGAIIHARMNTESQESSQITVKLRKSGSAQLEINEASLGASIGQDTMSL